MLNDKSTALILDAMAIHSVLKFYVVSGSISLAKAKKLRKTEGLPSNIDLYDLKFSDEDMNSLTKKDLSKVGRLMLYRLQGFSGKVWINLNSKLPDRMSEYTMNSPPGLNIDLLDDFLKAIKIHVRNMFIGGAELGPKGDKMLKDWSMKRLKRGYGTWAKAN